MTAHLFPVAGNLMTIDKSLKVRSGLVRNRSVLKRSERLAKLAEMDRWSEGDSPLGLAKVRVAKLSFKKKKKVKKEEEEGEGAAGDAAPAASESS